MAETQTYLLIAATTGRIKPNVAAYCRGLAAAAGVSVPSSFQVPRFTFHHSLHKAKVEQHESFHVSEFASFPCLAGSINPPSSHVIPMLCIPAHLVMSGAQHS